MSLPLLRSNTYSLLCINIHNLTVGSTVLATCDMKSMCLVKAVLTSPIGAGRCSRSSPGATTASAIPATIRRRACGAPRNWPTWRQCFGTDGRLLRAGSRGRAPGWNALPRALLPDVGDQGRVLGRFSRLAEGGDPPAHLRDNRRLGLRLPRGARRGLRARTGIRTTAILHSGGEPPSTNWPFDQSPSFMDVSGLVSRP